MNRAYHSPDMALAPTRAEAWAWRLAVATVMLGLLCMASLAWWATRAL